MSIKKRRHSIFDGRKWAVNRIVLQKSRALQKLEVGPVLNKNSVEIMRKSRFLYHLKLQKSKMSCT